MLHFSSPSDLTGDQEFGLVPENGTAVEAFWSGTWFLVTSTVFQPLYVSLSNIFGRKQLLLVALLHFTGRFCSGCTGQEFLHDSLSDEVFKVWELVGLSL